MYYVGVKSGRIHLQPRGVTSRQCGLLHTFPPVTLNCDLYDLDNVKVNRNATHLGQTHAHTHTGVADGCT